MTTTRVALVQINSGRDRDANLAELERWILAAANDGAKLIITPEYSDVRGDKEWVHQHATPIPGIVTERFSALARRTGAWIQLGSMHEKGADKERLGNTSVVFAPDGSIAAQYRKMHLYDAVINGVTYLESDEFCHGQQLQNVQIGDLNLGLSICYDMRFAELFRSLRARGANVLVVPAAFNVHTGRDHWEVLLRARAIENQCYVLAAAQIGGPGPAMPCLGRSMIIDPWGTVVACMPDESGYICADIDPARVARLRESLPAWDHRRGDLYPIPS